MSTGDPRQCCCQMGFYGAPYRYVPAFNTFQSFSPQPQDDKLEEISKKLDKLILLIEQFIENKV